MVKNWMNSPGHRANILGNYNQMGAGAFYNDRNGQWMGTQKFIFIR